MKNIKFPAKPFTVNSLMKQLGERKDGAPITRPGLFLKIKRAVATGDLEVVGHKDKVKVKGVKQKGRRSVIYKIKARQEAPAQEVTPETPEVTTEAVAETTPQAEVAQEENASEG